MQCAVLLGTPALTACVSAAAVRAVSGLASALLPASSNEPDARRSTEPQQACSNTALTDDLNDGLFSTSPELAGRPGVFINRAISERVPICVEFRPAWWRTVELSCCCTHAGPMQISLGDGAAGYMPWTGSGESWVCLSGLCFEALADVDG